VRANPRHRPAPPGRDRPPARPPGAPADVNWPSGIRRNVFEVDRFTSVHIRTAVIGSLGKNGAGQFSGRSGRETDVKKTRTGYFSADNALGGFQAGCQKLSQIAWLHSGALSKLHRNVGSPIAVFT